MTTLDYVRSLDLAHDPRLFGLQPDTRLVEGLRRGQVDEAVGEAFDDRLRAAVDAGSIVSFVAGVEAREKADVLFSTQLAQRAASARHDRFAATEDWYRVYLEVLEYLGWNGEGFAFTQRATAGDTFTMEKSALDVIAAIATGNQLAILVKTLDTLKHLAEDHRAIGIFDLQALAELSGNFQLGAVQRADNGALSMALGAFHFRTTEHKRRVLFWEWGTDELSFWTAAQKMTLNTEHYAPLREAVMAKLAADGADYIAGLEIA